MIAFSHSRIVIARTLVSKKGQVVIPIDVRKKLNLNPGTILRVEVEEGRVILEPFKELPGKAFVRAGPKITEAILKEAKTTSDKTQRLLKELGIDCRKSL